MIDAITLDRTHRAGAVTSTVGNTIVRGRRVVEAGVGLGRLTGTAADPAGRALRGDRARDAVARTTEAAATAADAGIPAAQRAVGIAHARLGVQRIARRAEAAPPGGAYAIRRAGVERDRLRARRQRLRELDVSVGDIGVGWAIEARRAEIDEGRQTIGVAGETTPRSAVARAATGPVVRGRVALASRATLGAAGLEDREVHAAVEGGIGGEGRRERPALDVDRAADRARERGRHAERQASAREGLRRAQVEPAPIGSPAIGNRPGGRTRSRGVVVATPPIVGDRRGQARDGADATRRFGTDTAHRQRQRRAEHRLLLHDTRPTEIDDGARPRLENDGRRAIGRGRRSGREHGHHGEHDEQTGHGGLLLNTGNRRFSPLAP